MYDLVLIQASLESNYNLEGERLLKTWHTLVCVDCDDGCCAEDKKKGREQAILKGMKFSAVLTVWYRRCRK